MPHSGKRVQFKLPGLRVQGDIGPLTCYTDRYGRLVSYLKAPPRTPLTPNQILQHEKLVNAGVAWRGLTANQRRLWHQAAWLANLAISGWNLYTLCFLRSDWSYVRTIERKVGFELPR